MSLELNTSPADQAAQPLRELATDEGMTVAGGPIVVNEGIVRALTPAEVASVAGGPSIENDNP